MIDRLIDSSPKELPALEGGRELRRNPSTVPVGRATVPQWGLEGAVHFTKVGSGSGVQIPCSVERE